MMQLKPRNLGTGSQEMTVYFKVQGPYFQVLGCLHK